ncbi:hypothetical protein [Actinacidiphila paucisporea]|uniref:Transposase n=1 Tax=Actinacidiphila paucisporea TaxID=310782 RepID=A0A1M7MNU9_9ACTN|nr:hypothetical protein SAMN05216499_116120 [Actinacidiphila paucisporea]
MSAVAVAALPGNASAAIWTENQRSMAWLAGCRRHRRYERKADRFPAVASIACTLVCYRRLT